MKTKTHTHLFDWDKLDGRCACGEMGQLPESIKQANKPLTHTPTPWKVNSPQVFMGITCVWIHGATGPVLKIEGSRKEAVLSDAAFIVRAVNCHSGLLEIAKEMRDELKRLGVGSRTWDKRISNAE